jgi:hypothetical protein
MKFSVKKNRYFRDIFLQQETIWMRSLKREVRAMNRCGTRKQRKYRYRSRANCIPSRISALSRQC